MAIFLGFFGLAGRSEAANYPLELINIKPAGTGSPAIGANNRIFKAYPGLDYNIRAAVIGGAYPYRYYLDSAPAGMNIDSNTGVIDWPNPQGNASATVRVVDNEGATVASSWDITVTTAGFHFVYAFAPSGGDGSLIYPWNSTLDFMTTDKWDSTHAGDFVYFRSGTYNLRGSMENSRQVYYAGYKPTVLMGYPGERPVLDFEGLYSMGVWDDDMYFDNLEVKNCGSYGFETVSDYNYYIFRRIYFHDGKDPVGGSNNQSYIRVLQNTRGAYLTVQDCVMEVIPGSYAGIKLYSKDKTLIEDNSISNIGEGVAIKMGNYRTTVRKNVMHSATNAISINAYAGPDGIGCNENEILFNLIYGSIDNAMHLGNEGHLGRTYVYRNTIIGTPMVRFVTPAEGPVRFYDNVIINSDGDSGDLSGNGFYRDRVYFENSPNTYGNSVIINSNLLGTLADGITESAFPYFLTVGYSQYIGTRGWQLDGGSSDTMPPSAPSGLSVN